MEKENIYTHVEDTVSNIYLNGIMLNSGTVMLMLEEKDQRIKELEKENKKLKRNLQYAYDDFNEMQQELDNLESDHNWLIRDKEEMFTDMQKEIKFQSDARKRLVKKLALYKKALELSCLKIYSGDISDFDYVLTPQNIEAHFLQEAKEKIKEVDE